MESTSSSSGNNNTNNNNTNSSNNTNTNNNNSNNTNDRKNDDFDNSKDEVDFAIVSTNNNNYTNNKNVGKKLVEYTTTTIPTTTTTIPTTTTTIPTTTVSGDNNNSCSTNESLVSKTITKQQQQQQEQSQQQQQQQTLPVPPQKETSSNNNSNTLKKKKKTTSTEEEKKPSSTKERLSLFSFNKKLSHKQSPTTTTTTTSEKSKTTSEKSKNESDSSVVPATPPAPTPRQHKFVKSSSIARLLGNTYNAKKFEKEEQKRLANDGKFNTYAGRRRLSGPTLERFRSKEDGDDVTGLGPTSSPAPATMVTHQLRDLYGGSRNDLLALEQQQHHHHGDRHADFGAKAMRTLSRGLGKLWWRRSHSVDISTPDPEFKVSYLGNVLTGWAKGEGCVEKQLSTLWRNYTQNNKPDVMMRIKVCASGLKATTRQHGLTEYWANRITHCCAPKNYPRVFCWIYRHEGRKLKHELRCHAVLCSKEKIVQDICNTLKENLERALREFKREKILKQNARLSLANAAYENPSLPRRKILLSVGGNNYRPPLERSKSAPKLMAIEEAIGEEDGEEVEETNEPEMKPCCQKDSLYPAMTLGRRRCRRGHSIRRTGKARPTFCGHFAAEANAHKGVECCGGGGGSKHTKENQEPAPKTTTSSIEEEKQRHSYGSDESDDFDKLLKYNNYDSTSSLANEILPYFDMQLHKKPISSSMGSLGDLKDEDEEGEPLSLMPTINSNPSAHPDADFSLDASPASEEDPAALGLRRNGVCSDGEEDYLEPDDLYFRQASILNMLHRNSMRKMANISLSSDESSSIETNGSLPLQFSHQVQSSISSNGSSTVTTEGQQGASVGKQQGHAVDSDEGSISSGCETASTVTANQDDISLRYRQSKQQQLEEQQHQAMTASPSALRDDVGPELLLLEEEDHPVVSAEDIYQRLESRLHGRHGSDATTFSSSSSITLKMGGGGGGGGCSSSSPTASVKGLEGGGNGNSNINNNNNNNASARSRKSRRPPTMIQCEQRDGDSDDSECSDESGYVEFQEREVSGAKVMAMVNQPSAKSKPLPPPKPMPRRLIGTTGATTAV